MFFYQEKHDIVQKIKIKKMMTNKRKFKEYDDDQENVADDDKIETKDEIDMEEIHLMFCLSKGIAMKRNKICADKIFLQLLIKKHPIAQLIYIFKRGPKLLPFLFEFDARSIIMLCEKRAQSEGVHSMGYYSYIYAKYVSNTRESEFTHHERAIEKGNILSYYELGNIEDENIQHRRKSTYRRRNPLDYYAKGVENGDSRCMYKYANLLNRWQYRDTIHQGNLTREEMFEKILSLYEQALNFSETKSIRPLFTYLCHDDMDIDKNNERLLRIAEIGSSLSNYQSTVFLAKRYMHNCDIKDEESNKKIFYYLNHAHKIERQNIEPSKFFKRDSYIHNKISFFLENDLIKWIPEYHLVFTHFFLLDEKCVTNLLLISKNRTSSKINISFMTKGIAMKIISFYCNDRRPIKL